MRTERADKIFPILIDDFIYTDEGECLKGRISASGLSKRMEKKYQDWSHDNSSQWKVKDFMEYLESEGAVDGWDGETGDEEKYWDGKSLEKRTLAEIHRDMTQKLGGLSGTSDLLKGLEVNLDGYRDKRKF